MADDTIKPKRDAESEKALRQFLNIDGPKGATQSYRNNWARIFGKSTGEHSGRLVVAATDGSCSVCIDRDCWCHA